MLLHALAATIAIVVQGQTTLRATAHDSAARQTNLVPGDWLEVRGEQHGFLSAYDHRHERPGYVRPSAVRTYTVDEATAPKLAAVVDYLRDAPGSESLGIGYVALFLRAAPATAIGAETFDALGTMAERLAKRASLAATGSGDLGVASELEVAESYGVHFVSAERSGVARVCYDGAAFRRVLGMADASGPAKVRAALGLTDPTCLSPVAGAVALETTKWRAAVLDGMELGTLGPTVPAADRERLRLRRAVVDSQLAFFAARAGDSPLAEHSARAADHELTVTDRAALADEDLAAYEEARIRVAAVEAAGKAAVPRAPGNVDVAVAPGEPGQTCLRITTRSATTPAPFVHCTYGLVWASSLRVAPRENVVTVNVQPLEGWTELLVLRRVGQSWEADTATPATIDPELGYARLVGFSPDESQLLVEKSYRASGPLGAPHTLAPWTRKTFQVLATSSLHVDREAPALASVTGAKTFH